MLNGTFLSWKETVKIIDYFSFRPKQSQWPHSWVILSNYARALLYCDLKEIVTESFAVTDITAMTGAVLFRSESKGSGFHANGRR